MGRPRNFDANLALDRAMRVFWTKGYEGASMDDLTRAMKINRPSLYAAFGNKEALFRKAIQHYADGPAEYVTAALARPTARGTADALLRGAADLLTDRNNPGGCLLVQGGLACGAENEGAEAALRARRASLTRRVKARMERAKKEGDLAGSAEAKDLARYLIGAIYGMAVQAGDGATRKDLDKICEMTMRAWPR